MTLSLPRSSLGHVSSKTSTLITFALEPSSSSPRHSASIGRSASMSEITKLYCALWHALLRAMYAECMPNANCTGIRPVLDKRRRCRRHRNVDVTEMSTSQKPTKAHILAFYLMRPHTPRCGWYMGQPPLMIILLWSAV